jgi:hypothetical protein
MSLRGAIMTITERTELCKADCCPILHPYEACDELDFRYRLPFRRTVHGQEVLVVVTLRFRLERCSGPLTLGNLLYTTTLLPGEQVRLLTTDRNSRFSFNEATQAQGEEYNTSQESFFLAGMADSMSNLRVLENASDETRFRSQLDKSGSHAGVHLGWLDVGGWVSATSYDADAARRFAASLSEHAETSSRHVEASVRAASSLSVSEVATRTEVQGQQQERYEAASRVFSNPNTCHAVTYLFYRIDKIETVRFKLVAVERKVYDPACPNGVTKRPYGSENGDGYGNNGPVSYEVRDAALSQVANELRGEGIINGDGHCTREIVETLSWERVVRLPTPGVTVKACLDECNACEPERHRAIELELETQELENLKLRRQIELLERSEEYRPHREHEYGIGDRPHQEIEAAGTDVP